MTGLTEQQRKNWDRYILSVQQGTQAKIESEGRRSAILAVALDYEVVKVELAEAKRRLQFEAVLRILTELRHVHAANQVKASIYQDCIKGKVNLAKSLAEVQEILKLDQYSIKKAEKELDNQYPDLYLAEFGIWPQE